ncbi:MAG: hypothetical protein EOO61_21400 [Hymenobacter sp.]|nr:MAG: hypothetical protein EOO61_21400 [Hymenobacter sp.]
MTLSPVERFVQRARKIELWQNEQHQLTTLGLDYDDWRDVYAPLFLELQRAIYQTDDSLLRAAYTELNLLLPTLHTRWLPRTDEYTGEESSLNNYFYASQFVDYWIYCEFVPLRPTSTTHSQRDPCLFAWLIGHINVKQLYVWKALELLAGKLGEPAPETPYDFLPRVPKPADLIQVHLPTAEPIEPDISLLAHNQTLPVLSPAERILGVGFTLSDADQLGRAVGIIDEVGRYCLGERKLGAIVGFCFALKDASKLIGNVPELIAVLGARWEVIVKTRKNNDLSRRYTALTNKALKRLGMID